MAEKDINYAFTLEAAADLSGKQYHIMRQSGANLTNQGSLATDAALIGVLNNKPQSGEAATIVNGGLMKVTAGAAITAAANLTTNSSGRAIAATSSAQYIVGRALEAAGADGDVITALLHVPVKLG